MSVAVSLPGIVTLLAVVASLIVGVGGVLGSARSLVRWSFGVGMLAFGVEAAAAFGLLGTEEPEARLFWLRALTAADLALLVPWLACVGRLGTPSDRPLPMGWRVGLGATALVVAGGIGVVLRLPAFLVSDLAGPFYAARLDTLGVLLTVVQVLGTVTILAGLERVLRLSRGEDRWRVKYLVLGLGGIFLVRFYLLSHLLLFHVVMAAYLTTGAATLVVGSLVSGVALARRGALGVELTLSRRVLYRSVAVSVLGGYLFVIGGLGWVLGQLGIGEELFWGSLAVFLSALGLAALLLSEALRWRLRRFIGLHFYRSKYDYREQWMTFTKRLGSLVALEELAPQLLQAVTEAVGTDRAALYLQDDRDGRYHLSAAFGFAAPPLLDDEAVLNRLRSAGDPILLDNGLVRTPGARSVSGGTLTALDRGVVVPLRWRGSVIGTMAVGPERTGAPYAPADLEFLATVAEQAAGAIATARLSEMVAEAREFEAFHRLTSFVVHDLKNSISALSILSQNALANFDDPEFQRDAIRTLSGTVERMRRLLARLTAAPDARTLDLQPVDLAAVAREALGPLARDPAVRIVADLAPVPPVLGEAETLLRVLQNLLANAREAVNGHGEITVRTYAEDGWAVCAVMDTGCGIPEAFLRKSLFTPFRSTKKGGWGIGLYQAKTIVEGHGGRIEVASREGEGTTFWIRLPAATLAGKGQHG